MKTSRVPPAMPGKESGRNTRRKAWRRLAPRLCAARTSRGSMLRITLYTVSTMYGSST